MLQIFVGTNLLETPIPTGTNLGRHQPNLTNIRKHQSTKDTNPDN
jgi:hypothetical protein